jgi:hypothetical protein
MNNIAEPAKGSKPLIKSMKKVRSPPSLPRCQLDGFHSFKTSVLTTVFFVSAEPQPALEGTNNR